MQIGMWFARKFLVKIRHSYSQKHNKNLPIIVVAGTAGKSSTTLLLKNMFERADWNVYSGATKEKCLNSVTGLAMVLGGFELDFEGKGGKLNKIWFILNSLQSLLFSSYKLQEDTILIYEVGFNEQFESSHFTYIFQDFVDILVLTNLTYEHSFGFAKEFDDSGYEKIKSQLSSHIQSLFDHATVESRLKNIVLEQFKLMEIAKHHIYPIHFGSITNSFEHDLNGKIALKNPVVTRKGDMSLVVNDEFKFDKNYLLPETFGKVAEMLDLIGEKYNISKEIIGETIKNLEVPNGRFSLLKGHKNSTIVDSTYNSDPASLVGFLDLVSEVIETQKSYSIDQLEEVGLVQRPKHMLILGEMRELGETAYKEHGDILNRLKQMSEAYKDHIDEICLLGSEWLKCDEEGIPKSDGSTHFTSYSQSIFKVFLRAGDITNLLSIDDVRPNSWFWVKGSQNTIFSEIVVEHLLADKEDSLKLCRRGKEWDEVRAKWV
jgi:UDP-N-acetylmuramyl pentapeptide synthase